MKVKVTQSCLTLCDPMDYSVHGIFQDRILERVAFPFSRGSSQPRDQIQVSCIAGSFFTSWVRREALSKWKIYSICSEVNYLVELDTFFMLFSCWWYLTLCHHMDWAHQPLLSFIVSWSLSKLKSIELLIPHNHLILFCPFSSCSHEP